MIPPTVFGSRKVLVVDDDDDTRQMLGMLLEINGWHVITAATGEHALSCLSREHVCLIVLDNRMPGMSGLDVVEHLRRTRHSARVIFVTGADDVADRLRELSVAYYLRKPVDTSRLLAIIQQECPPPAG
jgi:two-component system, response regulator, stage 0 sporulation protein F